MSDNQLATLDPKELVRISTDVAGLCKQAVIKTVMKISGKNYVKVEGWQTIGSAYGCLAEIESVEEAEMEGVKGLICWTKLKRISDGAILSRASAFLGDDEDQRGISGKKYARYAKVQTRAISRVLSNAFRFVVVLMDAGLETTPADEMPTEPEQTQSRQEHPKQSVEDVQTLVGPISDIGVEKEWMYGVVKGIEFATESKEIKAKFAPIEEGSTVRVVLKKVVAVAGDRPWFRLQSITVLADSHTQSETKEGE